MSGLSWRLACCLALFLPIALDAQAPSPSLSPQSTAGNRSSLPSYKILPQLLTANQPWQPVGPAQIVTPQFGDVTGRVSSIAIAPWDPSGNTVYLGSTGGGVWRSSNAAAADAGSVTWKPLTDNLPAFSGVNIISLSVGAVSVQPGASANGVVLAGTGDPNEAPDSYYGAGILRSSDGGTTWSLITQTNDAFSGTALTNYSFAGDAFSGFAWSTANPSLVVAAVTDSYDGVVNDINFNNDRSNVTEAGLYYSSDAGQSWHLSTIEDGPNQVIESGQTTYPGNFPGVPVTSVVWNPVRSMFYAAVRLHGYYQSPDGITWTRMANQPGTELTATNCPFTGSNSCTIFRGAIAVQPSTGDMFALTVDLNNVDQGLWQDLCYAGPNGCANPVVQFSARIPDAALDSTSGTIPLGTYNLGFAAIPAGTDTLLFAGTQDIFRCSLAAGCAWRNTTNAGTCASGKVAPSQHAIAALTLVSQTLPLLYFGNDSGIWRSTDGVNQSGAACASSDAAHYQNLNGGLGSLAEVTGLASSPTDADVVLAGFGVNGSAAKTRSGQTAWPQLSSGESGSTAIDPANPDDWYATLGPYVSIGHCAQGAQCAAANLLSVIGSSETSADQSLLNAPYLLDPADSTNIIVGTCRVWRGPASGGGAWSAANAISPMLDGDPEPSCGANASFPNALIRSLAAGGADVQQGPGAQNNGAQVIYAGMAGLYDGGGLSVGGHVYSTKFANLANGTTRWSDLASNPVTVNGQSSGGVFNPGHFDVSSLYVDPHDPNGNTIYAAIQGYGEPHLYLSTDGGLHWMNISKNLPNLPLNDVLVDPNDSSVVYVASDGGVFVTTNITNCENGVAQCWSILGTGLPLAPAVKLAASPADGGVLRVGTYGRGIWQIPLLSGVPQTTMTLAPTSLTYSSQPVNTASAQETVTVANTGTTTLTVNNIAISGDFAETDTCTNVSVVPNSTCEIQVTFTPSATGTRTGTLAVLANIPGGQQTIPLSGTGTAQPAIIVTPTSVSFAAQQVNTISASQQVTVSNTGSNSIALTSESVSGPFAIQTNTCSTSLPSNTGCTLAIVFQPTQSGAASGVLTVVTAQGTETISLSGTGESAATDTLAPASLIFSSTLENTASAPQTVTLTNTGGTALTGIQIQTTGDFAVLSNCGSSLGAQSACSLTVRYTPHTAGAETGSITVTDSLRIQTVSLAGTGIGAPTDTLSAMSLIFPATAVSQNATPQTVTLTNSGESALNQVSIQATGAGFGETNTCGSTLAAHATCVITGTFQALSQGTVTGQIDVADATRTQIISLSGSGEAPAADNLSTLSLNFSGQRVGTISASQAVTLSNNGNTSLTGIRFQSSNPDFMFTTTCSATLAAGASCAIQVAFAPHAIGPDSGTIAVLDAQRTQQIQLSGSGTLPSLTLTPGSLDFGTTGIQTSSPPETLLLSNESAGTITGISLVVVGPFVATGNCGSSLAPGATCSLSVVFSPGATGRQSGSITINSADSSAITAQATGVGIAYQLFPTSSSSASVTSGNPGAYSLELLPASGSMGNADLSCSNLPPNTTCALSPGIASLLAPSSIQVAIATGVGSQSASSARLTRAGLGASRPLELLLVLLSILIIGRRSRSLRPRLPRVLLLLLLIATASFVTACGKGGGPLNVGTPLPVGNLTPPGTYTLTVTAIAGGLKKSVNLTLQVQ